jgi:hypothetical protein
MNKGDIRVHRKLGWRLIVLEDDNSGWVYVQREGLCWRFECRSTELAPDARHVSYNT